VDASAAVSADVDAHRYPYRHQHADAEADVDVDADQGANIHTQASAGLYVAPTADLYLTDRLRQPVLRTAR
jgi:hypothetical protein